MNKAAVFLRREIGRPACRSLERERNTKVVRKVYGSKTRDGKESGEDHDG